MFSNSVVFCRNSQINIVKMKSYQCVNGSKTVQVHLLIYHIHTAVDRRSAGNRPMHYSRETVADSVDQARTTIIIRKFYDLSSMRTAAIFPSEAMSLHAFALIYYLAAPTAATAASAVECTDAPTDAGWDGMGCMRRTKLLSMSAFG